jgi:hypothetical protein
MITIHHLGVPESHGNCRPRVRAADRGCEVMDVLISRPSQSCALRVSLK